MHFKEAVKFVQDTLERDDKDKVKKKALQKVMAKLDRHAKKLERKIEKETDDKKLKKLESKLKLNRAHAKKGEEILKELD